MTYQIIRKNATKKIETLLNKATRITVDKQYRDFYSDCFETDTSKSNIAEVKEFMQENYGRLRLVLEFDTEGNESALRVELNGWSNKEFYINLQPVELEIEVIETTFIEEKAVKPRVSLSMVQEFIKAGFVSPLTSEREKEEESKTGIKNIELVKVIWSESIYADELRGQIVSIDEYNRVASMALPRQREYMRKNKEGYGYDKTKVELYLATGDVIEFRHDIDTKSTLSSQWRDWVDYCKAQKEKENQQVH